ncbi:MAG: 30S ribosomal protein S8 [Proteobacteria bacterium]|nr:30S ribosomal protein S8 [Pseudomonadota bacterium]NBX85768.1 30S ribosomal protein S8 [Pseudomonadota bacterium]
MPFTDPIADMLARLRNAQAQRKSTVSIPASKLKHAILNVLVQEGYISAVTEEEVVVKGKNATQKQSAQKQLVVTLKYYQGQPVLTSLKRVSTPGRRVYSAAEELPMVSNGLGITVVSTSKGILTDTQARAQKIGGEILCQIM